MPKVNRSVHMALLCCAVSLSVGVFVAVAQHANSPEGQNDRECAIAMGKSAVTLEELLRSWGKSRDEIVTLHCQGTETYDDRVLRQIKIRRRFEAWFVRPDLRRYDWRDGKGKLMTVLLAKGKNATLYAFEQQIEINCIVGSVSKNVPDGFFASWGWLANGGLVEVMLEIAETCTRGVEPQELRRQFEMSLLGENKHYAYLCLKPHEHTWTFNVYANVIIAFEKEHWLPRSINFYERNGNQARFDMTAVERNVRPDITPESLSKDLPAGWQKLRWGTESSEQRGSK